MKKIILITMMIILLTIFFFGSVQKEDKHQVMNVSSKLVYSMNSIPTDLQKVTNLTKREQDILCAISTGLISKNSKGEIVPEIAESYQVKDDGIEYDFKIRDNVCWSDGSKITSANICDFLKELIKVEDPQNISALDDVYGVSDFKKGKITFAEGVAITHNDDMVKIRLNQKNDNFINELTKPQYRIRKSLTLWDQMDKYYDMIVFSGKYKIVSISKASMELESVKNNNTIKFVLDTSPEAAMAGFELGKRDIIVNPPNNQISELNKKNKLITFPSTEGIYVVMNEQNSSLNIDTRKSIYKSLCKALETFEQENDALVDCSAGGYTRDECEDLELIQSRKVNINSAEDNISIKKLRICGLQSSINEDLCNYLVDWFKKNKNVEISFSLLSEQDFNREKSNKDYDLLLLNCDSNNNKELLFDKMRDLCNQSESNDNSYSDFEEKLFEDDDILPLVFLNQNICVSSKKIGLKFDYYGNIFFEEDNSTVEKATAAR